MVCLFCGSTAETASGTCDACGRALIPDPLPGEEAGLTRPPSHPYSDDAATLAPRTTPSPTKRSGATGPLQAGQIVNGRYHIIRVIGRGGMGAVYHAWDEELGVDVAMKVILPGMDETPAAVEDMARRFKKELLLARQITHRNVVRIHDMGEVDGIKFITMPFVKGEDLASILKRGPVEIPRALELARQIVSGLAAAHDAGVVHRDLKPANIMIEEGDWALLMDFGIARSVRGATDRLGRTFSGTIVGTIEYMAPEQARGEPADARADIYAVGLILYEMLAGRRQLTTGEGAVSELMSRMSVAPPPVRALRPDIPEPLDALVTRCVQPDPANRYQSCAELQAALDALDSSGRTIVKPKPRGVTPALIALACALVGVAAGVTYWATGRRTPVAAAIQRPPMSVLVANFTNATKDRVFEGTLEPALVLALEDAPFVSSYSRRTAQRVAASLSEGATLEEATARLVAKREGINVIIAGSVALENNLYVLTVRALDGASGRELSAARAEARSKDNVLAAISRVATAIRRSLGDATPEAGTRGVETFTASSLEAARAYEEAQQIQRAGDADGAIAAYRRAIALDPGLGRAYAGLAATYANAGLREKADTNYKLALTKIDRMTERERFRTRAGYYLFSRNPQGAIEQLSELVQKFPADVNERGNLAFAWFLTRNMSKALEIGRSVTALSPKDVLQRGNVALYAMYAGDFETAIKEAQEALKLNDSYGMAIVALAVSHLASGRVADAQAAYERLRAVDASVSVHGLADIALYEGRVEDAAALIEKGAAADSSTKNTSARARKLTALARARYLQGRSADAARLAQEAVKITGGFEAKVEAALVYLEVGMLKEASALADVLRTSLQPDPQAYALVLDGFVRLGRKQPREAVEAFAAAQKIADTWLGRFGVGRAYLELSAFPEAQAAFDTCLRRRGEATALFLDDLPTYHLFPPTYYYMGLAQEGLGSAGAAESFKTFVDIKQRGHDPLVNLARQHLAP